MDEKPESSTPRLPIRVFVRLGAGAVIAVLIVALVSGSHETRSVSEVIDEVHQVALKKPQGGLIGRWWVSAAGIDPINGRLQAFKVECGPIHIAARSARVVVNPHTDTFQFEMWDVVLAPVEDVGEAQVQGPTLLDLDRYMLGPIPYGVDIVPDRLSRLPALSASAEVEAETAE